MNKNDRSTAETFYELLFIIAVLKKYGRNHTVTVVIIVI